MLGILGTAQDNRMARRSQEFSAAVVFDFDEARSVNCLVRNSSGKGAQLRIPSDCAIAPGAWLVHLKRRMAFELFPVWRRPFLMGVTFAETHPIDGTLPPHLEMLKTVLVQAKMAHAHRVAALGACSREQQKALAQSYCEMRA